MPLFNILIGVTVGGVLLWMIIVFIVVEFEPSNPGEAILVDDGVYEYHDSISEQRAQSVANDQQGLGVPGSRTSQVGLGDSR